MNETAAGGTHIVTHAEPQLETLGRRTQQPAVVPSHSALARAGSMFVDRATRLGVVGIAGIAALVFCAAFIQSTLLPKYARIAELRDAIGESPASPARSPAAAPRAPAEEFVAKLPERDALPTVLAAIVQQAQSAGLSLERGAYQWSAGKEGIVARYQIALPVTGSYPAIRKFVDSTLAAVPAAALTGITLERPNVGDEQVSANLSFEVFVRNRP